MRPWQLPERKGRRANASRVFEPRDRERLRAFAIADAFGVVNGEVPAVQRGTIVRSIEKSVIGCHNLYYCPLCFPGVCLQPLGHLSLDASRLETALDRSVGQPTPGGFAGANARRGALRASSKRCVGGRFLDQPRASPNIAPMPSSAHKRTSSSLLGVLLVVGLSGCMTTPSGSTDSSETSSPTPVGVSGELSFATVSMGYLQACGVTTVGAAYCWGDNSDGELGNGSTTSSSTPTEVSGGLTFASVSAGYYATCGVTTAGAAYCWGFNADGQLGNGSTNNSSAPVAVSGDLSFTSVSAGSYNNACGVTTAGAAYCWGYNVDGELGNGSTTSSSAPVAVAGGLEFVSLSAGYLHSCGVTTGGAAYCWGFNGDGGLGYGTTTNSSSPVAVSGRAHVCGRERRSRGELCLRCGHERSRLLLGVQLLRGARDRVDLERHGSSRHIRRPQVHRRDCRRSTVLRAHLGRQGLLLGR